MKQVIQDMRTGRTRVVEVPVPSASAGQVLIRTRASLISSGTERMVVDFAGRSLVGKARLRPDLVRQVIDKTRRDGLRSAVRTAAARTQRADGPGLLIRGNGRRSRRGGRGFPPARPGRLCRGRTCDPCGIQPDSHESVRALAGGVEL